jgi:hypothetical protein
MKPALRLTLAQTVRQEQRQELRMLTTLAFDDIIPAPYAYAEAGWWWADDVRDCDSGLSTLDVAGSLEDDYGADSRP